MKISVLVPVYGVESYIETCVVSLFEQTYENLEYIFVDDCSPDNSVQILLQVLERYPKRQQQVQIIRHQKNRGLGAARATALQAATGDFVMVVDSDDQVPTDAISKLWDKQQETGADMVDGAFRQLTPDGLTDPFLPFAGKKEKMLRLMLLQNVIFHQLWGRLVRRSIYTDNHINSIEGIDMAEDYAVTPRLLYHCKRTYINDVVYYYRVGGQSSFSENLSQHHIVSFLKANGVIARFFQDNDAEQYYRQALHIGMLRGYHAALKTGMEKGTIVKLCGYQLPACLQPLCWKPLQPLLRLLYLVSKRLYALV